MNYTPETIQRIRSLAAEGWTHGAVAYMMGCELPALMRMVEKHRISFRKIVARSNTPDPVKAKIRWDGQRAWHGSRCVRLNPPEGRLFKAIVDARGPVTIDQLLGDDKRRVKRKNIAVHMSLLRDDLAAIGLTVTKKIYELART